LIQKEFARIAAALIDDIPLHKAQTHIRPRRLRRISAPLPGGYHSRDDHFCGVQEDAVIERATSLLCSGRTGVGAVHVPSRTLA
jgi:hypothetical protein